MNKIIILVSLIASLDIIDISLFSLILPRLQKVTKVSIDHALWIQYSYFLSSSATTLLLPILARYCTVQKLLIIACFSYLCGTLIQIYILQDYWLLIFSRILQGICVGILNPASLIILNKYFTGKNFVKAASSYGLIIMICSTFIPILYGFVMHHYGWQAAIIVNIIYCNILVLLCITFYPNINNEIFEQELVITQKKSLLDFSSFLIYLMVSCTYCGLSTGVFTFVSIIMQKKQAFQPEHVSFLISLRGVGSCMAFIFMPKLIRVFASKSLLFFSIIVTIISYSFLDENHAYLNYQISFLLQGIALSIFNTISTKNAFQNIPKNLNIAASSFYILGRFIANLLGSIASVACEV